MRSFTHFMTYSGVILVVLLFTAWFLLWSVRLFLFSKIAYLLFTLIIFSFFHLLPGLYLDIFDKVLELHPIIAPIQKLNKPLLIFMNLSFLWLFLLVCVGARRSSPFKSFRSFAADDRHCRTCHRLSRACCCWDEAFSISEIVDKGMVFSHRSSTFLRTYRDVCIYLGDGTCEL